MSAVSPTASSSAPSSSTTANKRGRKRDDNLPPNRARDVQRAFRARRASHLEALEQRVIILEDENTRLRAALDLPPSDRPALGTGPTGRGKLTSYMTPPPGSINLPPTLGSPRAVQNVPGSGAVGPFGSYSHRTGEETSTPTGSNSSVSPVLERYPTSISPSASAGGHSSTTPSPPLGANPGPPKQQQPNTQPWPQSGWPEHRNNGSAGAFTAPQEQQQQSPSDAHRPYHPPYPPLSATSTSQQQEMYHAFPSRETPRSSYPSYQYSPASSAPSYGYESSSFTHTQPHEMMQDDEDVKPRNIVYPEGSSGANGTYPSPSSTGSSFMPGSAVEPGYRRSPAGPPPASGSGVSLPPMSMYAPSMHYHTHGYNTPPPPRSPASAAHMQSSSTSSSTSSLSSIANPNERRNEMMHLPRPHGAVPSHQQAHYTQTYSHQIGGQSSNLPSLHFDPSGPAGTSSTGGRNAGSNGHTSMGDGADGGPGRFTLPSLATFSSV